jgi:hypothetical protein
MTIQALRKHFSLVDDTTRQNPMTPRALATAAAAESARRQSVGRLSNTGSMRPITSNTAETAVATTPATTVAITVAIESPPQPLAVQFEAMSPIAATSTNTPNDSLQLTPLSAETEAIVAKYTPVSHSTARVASPSSYTLPPDAYHDDDEDISGELSAASDAAVNLVMSVHDSDVSPRTAGIVPPYVDVRLCGRLVACDC